MLKSPLCYINVTVSVFKPPFRSDIIDCLLNLPLSVTLRPSKAAAVLVNWGVKKRIIKIYFQKNDFKVMFLNYCMLHDAGDFHCSWNNSLVHGGTFLSLLSSMIQFSKLQYGEMKRAWSLILCVYSLCWAENTPQTKKQAGRYQTFWTEDRTSGRR